jgi:hypothetical protein
MAAAAAVAAAAAAAADEASSSRVSSSLVVALGRATTPSSSIPDSLSSWSWSNNPSFVRTVVRWYAEVETTTTYLAGGR